MLAGARPFTGEYDQAVSYAIVNKEAEPVEKAAARDVPEVLAAAVANALKKDPSERFQSADEFIEALAPLTGAAADPVSIMDLAKQPKVMVFAAKAGSGPGTMGTLGGSRQNQLPARGQISSVKYCASSPGAR